MGNGKRAIVVLGAPSSGTRLMMKILIEAGFRGSDGHDQIWDHVSPASGILAAGEENPNKYICIRRHYPQERPPSWLIHPSLLQSLRGMGYAVDCIIMSRDWYHTQMSQIRAPHAGSVDEAKRQIQDCWMKIFSSSEFLGNFMIVSYESLVSNPELSVIRILGEMGIWNVRQEKCESLINGIRKGEFVIRNENKKYDL